MATTLSNRALLVSLQISQWTARKLDRSETMALNQRHGLTVEAARVNKNLLPLATELERVHQITAFIRKDFAKRTLPWGLEGVNILKADAYVEFTGVVRQWQAEWHGAVEGFLAAYPEYREEARQLLNGMFKPEDYPPVEDLARRFAFNIRFMPMPDQQDWRVDIGDEALARLREDLSRDIEKSMGEAMRSAWLRVYDVVNKAHERLANPENIFRDTLVENAIELCALLPSLNVLDDPNLERARQAMERSICAVKPDVLREDLAVREQVAGQMADILRKMKGAFPVAA